TCRYRTPASTTRSSWIMNASSIFFFSSRRRHTRWPRDWSSDVCSSDLLSLNVANRRGGVLDGLALAVVGVDVDQLIQARLSAGRSEERRVGKEGRSRWAQGRERKKARRPARGPAATGGCC